MKILSQVFFCVLIGFVCIHTANSAFEEVKKFLKSNFLKLYAPITGNVSEECLAQSEIYHDALMNNALWALRMEDASGKFPSGIFSGNLVELGQFDQCLAASHTENETTIEGKYCLTTISMGVTYSLEKSQEGSIEINSSQAIGNIIPIITPKAAQSISFRWAICVPDACTANDVANHLNNVFGTVLKGQVKVTVNELNCQSKNTQPTLNAGDWVMIVILVLIGLLLIGQTFYEGYLMYTSTEPLHPLLLSFSIISNGRKLSRVSNNADKFNCLDGIRCFSMLWVVLGHRLLLNIVPGTTYNSLDVLSFFDYWYNYFPLGGMVAVDTFFVMAGMLLMYILLKKNILENPINVLMLYIHRYLRLTPPLLFTLLFVLTLSKFVGSGPFWPTVTKFEKTPCEDNWWSLLLYIQNYRKPEKICLGHTWYLSADTQMFFISPFIIYGAWKLGKYGIYFLISLIAIFMIVPLVIVLSYDIPASYKAAILSTEDYFHIYYFPTHNRAATYIVGLTLGYLMFTYSKRRIRIKSTINIACWTVALVVMAAILLCQYPMNQPDYERMVAFEAFYISVHRVLWAVCLSWIIFACSFGYGGPVNWLLSRPLFQILAKLTYCMYIVHFSMLFYRMGSKKTTDYFSSLNVYWDLAGDLIFITIVATIWSLAFELPFQVIEEYFFRSKSKIPKKVVDSTHG